MNKLFKIEEYNTASSTQISLAPSIARPIERDLLLLASINPEMSNRVDILIPKITPIHNGNVKLSDEGESKELNLMPNKPAVNITRLLRMV